MTALILMLILPLALLQIELCLAQRSDGVFYPSRPKSRSPPHHDAWMNSGKFQGDIIVKPRMYNTNLRHPSRDDIGRLQNGVVVDQMKWPNGVIPFLVDKSGFSRHDRQIIESAMDIYAKETCIEFVPKRLRHTDFLHIVKGNGCYSQVGRAGGRQEVSLGDGCLYHEIVIHELMHAVGFWHEHSRVDRDEHIRILKDNIIPGSGMDGQFEKVDGAYQNLVGPYDYKSVMHYDSTAFSNNGRNTIETLVGGYTRLIGTALDLSQVDVQKINSLYNCRAKRPKSRTKIKRRVLKASTQKPTLTTFTPAPPKSNAGSNCTDRFRDCPFFKQYCGKSKFMLIMRNYCPKTCRHCAGQGPTVNRRFIGK